MVKGWDVEHLFLLVRKVAALQVVNGWDMELKQQFVLFVTGSRRLPQPHTELLQVQLPFVAFDRRDHANMLSRLPQVPADASPYAM